MSDREMMEETKKEDPVSVENAAQEDQITEVPADETVGQNAEQPSGGNTAEQSLRCRRSLYHRKRIRSRMILQRRDRKRSRRMKNLRLWERIRQKLLKQSMSRYTGHVRNEVQELTEADSLNARRRIIRRASATIS